MNCPVESKRGSYDSRSSVGKEHLVTVLLLNAALRLIASSRADTLSDQTCRAQRVNDVHEQEYGMDRPSSICLASHNGIR